MKEKISLAVVYHSGYGHTKVLAEHVLKGAAETKNVEATLFQASEVQKNLDALTAQDAMIFGCPTYMGSGSSVFKAFMEATVAVWMKRSWKDKIAAGFTNSMSMSGDKSITIIQLAAFAAQQGMIWVPSVEMNNTGRDPAVPAGHTEGINRLGSWMGLMSQSNDKPVTPAHGDLITAERFGAHVAQVALKWNGVKES